MRRPRELILRAPRPQAAELEASAMSGQAAEAAGTAQLARALVERDCAGLRKQSARPALCGRRPALLRAYGSLHARH
jgi:hypothetical protein